MYQPVDRGTHEDLVNTKHNRRTDRWTDKVIHMWHFASLVPQNVSFDKCIIISNEDKNEGTCKSANFKQKLTAFEDNGKINNAKI